MSDPRPGSRPPTPSEGGYVTPGEDVSESQSETAMQTGFAPTPAAGSVSASAVTAMETMPALTTAPTAAGRRRPATPGRAAERVSSGSPPAAKRGKAAMRIGSEESSPEIPSATAPPIAATASVTPAVAPIVQTAASSSASVRFLPPGTGPLQPKYKVTPEQQQAAMEKKAEIVESARARKKKQEVPWDVEWLSRGIDPREEGIILPEKIKTRVPKTKQSPQKGKKTATGKKGKKSTPPLPLSPPHASSALSSSASTALALPSTAALPPLQFASAPPLLSAASVPPPATAQTLMSAAIATPLTQPSLAAPVLRGESMELMGQQEYDPNEEVVRSTD